MFVLWYLKDQLVKTSDKNKPKIQDYIIDSSITNKLSTLKYVTESNSATKYQREEIKNKCDMKKYLDANKLECRYIIHDNDRPKTKRVHTQEFNDVQCNLDMIYTDCSEVKNVLLHGKEDISKEEKTFPLAFAMKIHTSGNQAFKLLQLIYRTHNVYCIHVDKKAPFSLYQQFKSVATCVENIFVIEDRINVVYSSIRQIEAEFKCIDAVQNSSVKWKYYINLTGQEYMLKTNLEIIKILQLLNGTNDIESYNVKGFEHRFKKKFWIINNRIKSSKKPKEDFPYSLQIRKGSAYGMFSRAFIEFVRTDSLSKQFKTWLEDTYAPEETIWATLNSLPQAPGGYPRVIIHRNSTLTKDYSRKTAHKNSAITGEYVREITHKNSTFLSRTMIWSMEATICHGKYVHWVCIFGEKDLPWLIQQKQMIANKFYQGYGGQVLDCLEKYLYDRTMFPYLHKPLNLSLYADIPHLHL